MARVVNSKVLNAVTATGASGQLNSMGHTNISMIILASSVTTGATIKLQGSADGTNWADLGTATVNANGTTLTNVTTFAPILRANITARTDGTYTVWITGAGNAGIA